MAKEDIQKLREVRVEDLIKELTKERHKLQQMRFDLARGKVKNSAAVRNSKKRIAKLLTLISEKKMQEVTVNEENG